MRIVLVIPTYKEKGNIVSLLESLNAVYKAIPKHQFFTLFVDSFSPDGTAEVIKKEAEKYGNVVLIEREKAGIGIAYAQGFEYAIKELKADYIFEFDADLSHDPQYIPQFVEALEGGYDGAVGSRYIKGGGWGPNHPRYRVWLSYFGSLFARIVLGMFRFHDITSGYRVTKVKGFLDGLDIRTFISPRFAYKVELFYLLFKRGANIKEVPIIFYERKSGSSKIAKKDLTESFRVVFVLAYRKYEEFLKVCVVGFIGFIVNAVFLRVFVEAFGLHPALGNVFAAELSIISNFLWNNFWTFKARPVKAVWPMRFLQFNLASVGSVIIGSSVIWLGVYFFGRALYMAYFIIGVLLGLISNFFFYTRLIWKKK